MITFSQNQNYRLIFSFRIPGLVNQSALIGALLSETGVAYEQYSLSKLQQKKKVGKIDIHVEPIGNSTTGHLQIPVALGKIEAAILAAIIENITKVGLYEAKITLDSVRASSVGKKTRILERAKEICTLKMNQQQQGFESVASLKQTLEGMLDKSKVLNLGSFCIGPSFQESEEVIMVEGRRDVANLFRLGIKNTIAINGLNFDENELTRVLKGKKVCFLLDGDTGGNEIFKRLQTLFPSYSYYPTPQGVSVEDLSRAELFKLLKEQKRV